MNSNIDAYKIAVPDSSVERLKQKLALTDLPNEIEGSSWKYGVPLSDIKRLKKHWETKFDWRAEEWKLNAFPQFVTKITVDGFEPLNIHFIHQKSGVPGAIPLLFVHGWPGSFIEASKIIPLLKGGGEKPVFDIVAPSLPNFAFSSGVTKPGFALAQYAETCHKLMLELGYDQYVTQGGDWGFFITRTLAHLYPKHCKACHVNWIFASPPKWTESNPEPEYSDREKAALGRAQEWWAGDGRG
jgi:pimeloyl-ACP methyl ester carboxylesterase